MPSEEEALPPLTCSCYFWVVGVKDGETLARLTEWPFDIALGYPITFVGTKPFWVLVPCGHISQIT